MSILMGVVGGVLGATRAGADDRPVANWQGVRVLVPSSNTPVRLDGRIAAVLNAGSVFRVDRAEGGRLWLDVGNLRGWVLEADVLRLDRAIEHFTETIRKRPEDSPGWVGRGIARFAQGDAPGAVEDLSRAIRIQPGDFWAFHNRSAAHHALADYSSALADAETAVRLNPGEPSHLANRASAHFARGQFKSAAGDYAEAIKLLKGGETSLEDAPGDEGTSPSRARLWSVRWTCARAECWEALRASDRALGDLSDALRLDPHDFATLNALAWTLATSGDPLVRDGRRAFELAARACDLTGYRNHACLGTLAAAFSELGDRTGAVRWLRRALELAEGDRKATDYRERLIQLERQIPPSLTNPEARPQGGGPMSGHSAS